MSLVKYVKLPLNQGLAQLDFIMEYCYLIKEGQVTHVYTFRELMMSDYYDGQRET